MNVLNRTIGIAVSLVAFSAATQAQALPAAKDLIARYAKESGADAWKSHKSARTKETMEVMGMGLRIAVESATIFDGRQILVKMTVPGMGEAISGFDGTSAWMKEPTTGARVLSGAEAEQATEEADPEASSRLTKGIVSSETVQKESVNGAECYKVKHTWKSGRVTHDCFGVDDGLLVSTTATQVTPMGEMEVTQYYSDYKEIAGMKRATVMTGQLMGQQIKRTLLSWEWDTVTPADVEPPADIKALLKKG